MGGAWITSQHILDDKSRSDLINLHELRGKRHVAQVSQTRGFALYSRTRVVLMLQLESSWHGRSVDHVSTYFGRQIAVRSQKPSRITSRLGMGGEWIMSQNISDDKPRLDLRNLHELRGKRLVAESSWHGRSVDYVSTYSRQQIAVESQNLHELRGKRLVAQVSEARRFALYLRTGVVLMLQLESSWHGRSVDHVSTYSGGQIAVGSRKPSRIKRQKARCAIVLAWEEREDHVSTYFRRQIVVGSQKRFHELQGKRLVAQVSQTRRFANGFDAPIGVVLAWEERGSCLNIFRMTNRGRISETFTNY
ncbi:uncharacterized protein G2W53_033646 [Senna tora]|uniref:Uncharacterized protein n=1 Tax=Senna tora TaxID=362788 RepID=A0A834T0Y6_9FABA|nr:uncharacterized protein G2W53_033646 [Senna tora]